VPEGGEQADDPAQPGLEDGDRLLEADGQLELGIDLGESDEGGLGLEGVLQDGVDQGVLVGEDPEDRALGDAGRLRDLAGADLAPVLDQQRLGRRHDGSAPFVGGEGSRAGHVADLSE